MSIWETVLVYAAIPVAALLLLGVTTMAKRPHKVARYKPGQPWDHDPVWWSANPGGLDAHPSGARALRSGEDVVGGGARGTW